MSRVSIIEQLYADKKKSALEFNYDNLWAPPISLLLSPSDIDELRKIATSVKLNGKIDKKYELIDNIMRSRGFKRAHCGTNRVVYNYLEDIRFVAKIAVDRVGMNDSPNEFRNQRYFKPFCTKIFEVDPSGVVAFCERVNPITSIEEFASVADDIFTMMVTKIIGKYVVDDLGASKFMNYGLRQDAQGHTFGPVILDFPYAYELDGDKLICNRKDDRTGVTCGGDIDYISTLDYMCCTKCGKKYTAQELSKDDSNVIHLYSDDKIFFKTRIKDTFTGEVLKVFNDNTSKNYLTKDELKERSKKVFI